jgi:hypothetical protein
VQPTAADDSSEEAAELALGESETAGEEGAAQDGRETRGRRRRRRRGGRGRERRPAEERGAAPDLPSAAPPGEAALAEPADADDHADDQSDEDDEDDRADKPSHKSITSWEETIGILVAANMEARARNPSGHPPRGRHRGRPG